MYNGMF